MRPTIRGSTASSSISSAVSRRGVQRSTCRRSSADPSGFRIPIRGQAILEISFADARGRTLAGTDTAPNRTAFALPNVLTTVQSGDGFENVVSYGVGLAVRQPFRISTLSNPSRVVLDIDTAFSLDEPPGLLRELVRQRRQRLAAGREHSAAHQLMDRLYVGPTAGESAGGLRFVRSGVDRLQEPDHQLRRGGARAADRRV